VWPSWFSMPSLANSGLWEHCNILPTTMPTEVRPPFVTLDCTRVRLGPRIDALAALTPLPGSVVSLVVSYMHIVDVCSPFCDGTADCAGCASIDGDIDVDGSVDGSSAGKAEAVSLLPHGAHFDDGSIETRDAALRETTHSARIQKALGSFADRLSNQFPFASGLRTHSAKVCACVRDELSPHIPEKELSDAFACEFYVWAVALTVPAPEWRTAEFIFAADLRNALIARHVPPRVREAMIAYAVAAETVSK